MKVEFEQIGRIFTSFTMKEGMPIQSSAAKGIKGKIVLKEKFATGLNDLGEFSHIFLIYYFHQSKNFELEVQPFLDNKKRGVFATRAPKRPNPIGISVVRLLEIENNVLYIENVDILNETPLLDIKPYIPEFDNHKVERKGWLEDKVKNLTAIKSDNRFI